ncbi:MAG: tRNA (guanosine(46)-N7)-methyltransferase TrmB [Selenomonadaceae bacterium]|nr:tRNA (guanosine(46)-N7)-methyltransferase TrmB [Selenomonadaceae bacterium]
MRLRRKPWVDEALEEFSSFVFREKDLPEDMPGKWQELFPHQAPLWVELGTGKGDFISQMGELYPEVNFVGLEAAPTVIYAAARKVAAKGLNNARLLIFDINNLEQLFAPQEIDRLYINFCDPWPKRRHAKRRLTHADFLAKYQKLLTKGGELHFKTDNRPLFDFSLGEFRKVGAKIKNLTYDLHAENPTDNIETEYERKFSALGEKINRCEVVFT